MCVRRLARRRESALTCATALWCLQGIELAWRLAPGQLAAHAERPIVLPLERMALVERLAMASLFFQVRPALLSTAVPYCSAGVLPLERIALVKRLSMASHALQCVLQSLTHPS